MEIYRASASQSETSNCRRVTRQRRALDGASRLKQNRMNMGGAPDMLTCRNNGLMVKSFTFFLVASHGFSYLRQQLAARCCGDSAVTAVGGRSKLQAASETTVAAHNPARTPTHNSKFAGPSFSSSLNVHE